MAMIEVQDLVKVYRVYQKREGFLAAVRGLLRREYKYVRAVDGISFQIEEGEIVGFLGPNGAGKTTTLKMLSGLIFPTSGSARVMGFVPWERANEFRRQFALVMGQRNQLWWDLPAIESFRLHREIYQIERQRYERVLGELTELLDVEELLHQPVRELSLGERMKMEIICAMLHSPRVVLLDEPTIGLDVTAQAAIQSCLRELNRRHRTTILLTSHYMRDVEMLCERIIVITHGRIIYDGALAGVLDRFGDRKLIRFQVSSGQQMPRPSEFDGFVQVIELSEPYGVIQVERAHVSAAVELLVRRLKLEDLSVEDPPLEEVIADVFSQAEQQQREQGDRR